MKLRRVFRWDDARQHGNWYMATLGHCEHVNKLINGCVRQKPRKEGGKTWKCTS